LVGHSHGGNIALASVSDPAVAKSVSQVVALATPFLSSSARGMLWPARVVSSLCVIAAFFAWLFGSGWVVTSVGNWVFGLASTGLGVALGLLRTHFEFLKNIPSLSLDLADRMVDWVEDMQSSISDQFNTVAAVPLRCLRFGGDEARAHLRLMGWLTEPAHFAIQALSLSTAIAVGVSFGAFLLRWFWLVLLGAPPQFVLALGLAVPISIVLSGLLGLAWIAALASGVARDSRVGYGFGRTLRGLLVRLSVQPAPPKATLVEYAWKEARQELQEPAGLGLRHSAIYVYPLAIAQIVAWLRPEVTSALQQSA
jgi:hypothetical protein